MIFSSCGDFLEFQEFSTLSNFFDFYVDFKDLLLEFNGFFGISRMFSIFKDFPQFVGFRRFSRISSIFLFSNSMDDFEVCGFFGFQGFSRCLVVFSNSVDFKCFSNGAICVHDHFCHTSNGIKSHQVLCAHSSHITLMVCNKQLFECTLAPSIFKTMHCNALTTPSLFNSVFVASDCTTLGVVPALKANDATLFKLNRVDA